MCLIKISEAGVEGVAYVFDDVEDVGE